MQDVSISVVNITLNDSGIYTCNVTREFDYEIHRPVFTSSTLIRLTVVAAGMMDCLLHSYLPMVWLVASKMEEEVIGFQAPSLTQAISAP